jgi:hypothetical protein
MNRPSLLKKRFIATSWIATRREPEPQLVDILTKLLVSGFQNYGGLFMTDAFHLR